MKFAKRHSEKKLGRWFFSFFPSWRVFLEILEYVFIEPLWKIARLKLQSGSWWTRNMCAIKNIGADEISDITRPSRQMPYPRQWMSSRCWEGLQPRQQNMIFPSTFSHLTDDCASRAAYLLFYLMPSDVSSIMLFNLFTSKRRSSVM